MTSRARLWRPAAALLLSFALGANAASGQTVLTQAELARSGIAVTALHTARIAQSIRALGAVLDPAPLLALAGQLATLDAQIAGAKAKVLLEQQQMAQASALYKHGQVISLANYQKAQQELAASQAALTVGRAKRQSLQAQIEATWGATVAAMLRTGGDPLPQLAAGKAMLIGLSLPPGATLAAPPHQVEAEAAGIRFAARLIAPVPRMLGGFPGQAFLYEAAAQPGVPIGATVSASLAAGAERTGVLVPWSAVLWRDGRAVVFRAAGDGRFEPVPIATDVVTERGYFVSDRLARGNRIVVRGAALLLGGPSRPAAGADEDED